MGYNTSFKRLTALNKDLFDHKELDSTIYSIRESSIKKDQIWVGSNDGLVHLTKDGGKNWINVTPKNLLKGGRVDSVEPSKHDPATSYRRGKSYNEYTHT